MIERLQELGFLPEQVDAVFEKVLSLNYLSILYSKLVECQPKTERVSTYFDRNYFLRFQIYGLVHCAECTLS